MKLGFRAAAIVLALSAPLASQAAPALTTPADSMIKAPAPQDFAATALEHDRAMVALGSLAEHRARKMDVRKLGRTLRLDDSRAIARLTRVAASLNIALPHSRKQTLDAQMQRLEGLKGDAFDQAFLKAVVERLLRARVAYRIEEAATNGRISDLAGKELPAIHKHLSMALKLQHPQNRPHGT